MTCLGGGPLLTVLGVLPKIIDTTNTTNTTITTCGVQQFSAERQGYNGGARFPPSTVVLVLVPLLVLELVFVESTPRTVRSGPPPKHVNT